MTWLSRFAPPLQSILRIVAGLLFLEHGMQKLFGFPPLSAAMAAMHVPDNVHTLLLVAGSIELVTGALITLGLFSRFAAFIGREVLRCRADQHRKAACAGTDRRKNAKRYDEAKARCHERRQRHADRQQRKARDQNSPGAITIGHSAGDRLDDTPHQLRDG